MSLKAFLRKGERRFFSYIVFPFSPFPPSLTHPIGLRYWSGLVNLFSHFRLLSIVKNSILYRRFLKRKRVLECKGLRSKNLNRRSKA
jgi:hypothetical protein